MIIFVGTEDKGFFLQDVSIQEKIFFTGYIKLDELKSYVLKNENSCIVIDVTLWSEDSKIIADKINDVAASTRSRVIVFAVGYPLNSKLCCALREYGIRNIITAGNLADIKTEFKAFYNDESTEIIKRVTTEPIENEIRNFTATTIAVVGAQNRIGTTTQCFQIVKYLSSKGYKAAYLEFNDTDYLKKMKRLFGLSENDFSFECIHIYSKEQINKVVHEFDYIVYDYGSIISQTFNQYSFLERNISIVICGAKAGEIEYSTQALGLMQKYNNVIYLFNFVARSDETDIIAQMGHHKTYFSPLIPDTFSVLLEQQELYNKILGIKNSPALPQKNNSIFNKWRKNNGKI